MDLKNSTKQIDNIIYTVSDQLGIKRVSVNELRKCKEFENYSDEEAQSLIESLYQLGLIAYQAIR